MATTVGALILNAALPPELRREQFDLDKKGVHALLQRVAEDHPDHYAAVHKAMNEVGRMAGWTEGVSVSLAGLRTSRAKQQIMAELQPKLQAIRDRDDISDKERAKQIVDLLVPYSGKMQDALLAEAKSENNPYYVQISSGARGKKSELSSLRGADFLTEDQTGRLVPIPILRSYAEGYSPAEYFAASYGQRKGQVAVKAGTADAGYATKMLVNAAHRKVVTREKPDPTRLPVGLPFSTSDKELVGHVLAQDAGAYKAGTLITRQIQDDLADQDLDEVLVHSPLTEVSQDGGLSSYAAGKRHRKGLSPIGDNVGIAAAQAIGEKMSQGLLCLAEGTLVRMADDSVKPIEQIVPGDWVLGSDKQGNSSPVRVLNTFDQGDKPVWQFALVDRYDLRSIYFVSCTPDHKFLSCEIDHPASENVLPIRDVSVRHAVRRVMGGQTFLSDAVYIGEQHCWDIEVDSPDHLFVLANGLITSNSAKHSAGIGDRVSKSGVEYIFRLLGAPDQFQEAGPLAEDDGEVEEVRQADQGGTYVRVAGRDYYLNPAIKPAVKVGDKLEQGDDLSDGIPHPKQLVKYRGLGEARRVYADLMHEALNNSGVDASKRNVHAVVSGLMNWARVTNPDGIGDAVVDDIVPFNQLMTQYKPRTTSQLTTPDRAKGMYLDEPVLHYTPGTRLNQKVVQRLNKFGIKDIHANQDPPDFEPEFVRSVHSVYNDPDWQTRLGGFYTASAFTKSVHRGLESDSKSTSFIPALARSDQFGRDLPTTGKY